MGKVTELKHKHHPSIYQKIRRGVCMMTLLMFGLFWGVIYFVENQIEVLSLHHWLDTEAQRYTSDYHLEGDSARLPHEREFSTYWSVQAIPEWLKNYDAPGFYEHLLGEEDKHFLVTSHPSGQGLMYIVFQDDVDDYLDDYEWTLHNITFFLGGLVSLLTVLYGFHVVQSLARPLNRLEDKIRQMPPSQPMFDVDTEYAETRRIEQALLDSKIDIAGFFQREKEFSRFASHELRTPIMVVRGSTDLLAKISDMPPVAYKAVSRLDQACEQMRILTETFLLLGKESIDKHYFSQCDLYHELIQRLDEMAPLFAKQDASYDLRVEGSCSLYAPSSFVTIVINNLVKNAFSYSVGDIQILVREGYLEIANNHLGNETYNEGYGCGLVIVERICQRMNWEFVLEDNARQFIARIHFGS